MRSTIWRKLLISFSILLIIICAFLGTLILLFNIHQDEIKDMITETLNENFEGRIEIDRKRISLFGNFPYISIDIHGMRFFAAKDLVDKPIYEIDDLYVGFEIWDLLKGNYVIKSLKIKGGHLDVVQYENGDINLLLAKGIGKNQEETKEIDGESEGLNLELKEVLIESFYLSKYNESTDQMVTMDLNKATIKFRQANRHLFLDLDSEFVMNVFKKSDSSFLFKEKHIHFDTELDYDERQEFLKIPSTVVTLEGAEFRLEGSMDFTDDFFLNITLQGLKPDFNLFASIAPPEVADQIKRFENAGRIYFVASVEGAISNLETPSVKVTFGCNDAFFVNRTTGKRVDQVRFKGFYTNGADRTLSSSEFHFMDFYAKPEEGIFQGSMVIKNFEDPFIAVNLNSDLDLEFLGQFLGVEGLQRVRGQVVLDMNFNEIVDFTLPSSSLERLKEGIQSELSIRNLTFTIPDYPNQIKNMNAHATMEQGVLVLEYLDFEILKSALHLEGKLNNLPALIHKEDIPVRIDLKANSKWIDFTEILPKGPTDTAYAFDEQIENFKLGLSFETSVNSLSKFDYLPKGEFYLQQLQGKFSNYPHFIHDFYADVVITEKDLVVKKFRGEIDKSDLSLKGRIENYPMWFKDSLDGHIFIHLDLQSRDLHFKDLLSYKGINYMPEEYLEEEILGLNLHVDADLVYDDSVLHHADIVLSDLSGKFKLHPLKLENFNGQITYSPAEIIIKDFGLKLGESNMKLNLNYVLDNELLPGKTNLVVVNATRLNLDELMAGSDKTTVESSHEEAWNIFQVPFSNMEIRANIASLKHENFLLENMVGRLRMTENHFIYIDTMYIEVAGGKTQMMGYFNGSNPDSIYFKSNIKVDHVDLSKLLLKFDNFGQDVILTDNLQGLLTGTVESTLHMHPDMVPILEDSEAHIEIAIHQGSLRNFAPMEAMSGFFQDKNLKWIRFDTLQNVMDLKNGVLLIPNMGINSSLGYIELSGQQRLDLTMDYFIRVPLGLVTQVGAKALFGKKSVAEIDPEQEDQIVARDPSRKTRFINVRVSGNPDDFKVGLGRNRNKQ